MNIIRGFKRIVKGNMERLTIEYCGEYVPRELCSIDRMGGADDCDLCSEYCKATENGNEDCRDCAINKCFNKLAEYEDLEEQGKLLKLPCAVGNKVWDNDSGKPCSYTVAGFSIGKIGDEENDIDELEMYYRNWNGSICCSCAVSEIGKTVFLTREEAESEGRRGR